MSGEVLFFSSLARELALKPLEGVHVRVLVLIGVVMVGHAVERGRVGGWLTIRGGASAVVKDGGGEGAGRGLGGHGGQSMTVPTCPRLE